MKNPPNELIAAARAVRQKAYAPYSHFAVGAALLLRNGTVVVGANVENCSYGLAICAERSAVVSAVAQGMQPGELMNVAVVVDAPSLASPCGACRQVLSEFAAPDARVWMMNLRDGACESMSVAELLPAAFAPASLQ